MLLIAVIFQMFASMPTPASAASQTLTETGAVIRTVATLAKMTDGIAEAGVPFDITATVTSPVKTSTQAFVAEDSS